MGFRYSVTLPKDATGNVPVNLADQNQFPITVRMTHPEIIDPNTGKGTTVSTWTDTMLKHNKNLAMWYFGADNEIVSGKWTLELLYRDSVVAKKSFHLANLDDPKELENIAQVMKMRDFILNGDKLLCKQEKFQTCFNFSSTEQCVEAFTPYNTRCQDKAGAHVQQLKVQGKMTGDGLQQYFGYFAVCLGRNYIPTIDLDPEQVGQCLQK